MEFLGSAAGERVVEVRDVRRGSREWWSGGRKELGYTEAAMTAGQSESVGCA